MITDLEQEGVRLSPAVKANLDGLGEIRDNAIHFVNLHPRLSKQVLELGTAAVKNFIELAKEWFGLDLSEYNLYLMPIGFVNPPGAAVALGATPDQERLLQFLTALVKEGGADPSTDFHVALEVKLSFKRAATEAVAVLSVTNDPSATKVEMTEENIRKIFQWDYAELTRKLKLRYIDFKANEKYHRIREPLLQDPKLVWPRYLDPGNPRSARKDFYNPNVIAEFDKHYTRPSTTPAP